MGRHAVAVLPRRVKSTVGTAWQSGARCRDELLGIDPELFFPIGHGGPARLQADRAKAECRRCPVASECLQWALEDPETYGVWGGTTEEERRMMIRRRNHTERKS